MSVAGNLLLLPSLKHVNSVNLGGWFNTEPFIAPALYEPYMNAATPAVDEWTLSLNMAADTANGGLSQLEKHYATFIVCSVAPRISVRSTY